MRAVIAASSARRRARVEGMAEDSSRRLLRVGGGAVCTPVVGGAGGKRSIGVVVCRVEGVYHSVCTLGSVVLA